MALTNYEKGRSKEYRIVNKLKKDGYNICFRSAGSHSPIDVIAIHKNKKEILFVQSKPKSMSENTKKKLKNENSWLDNEFLCRFEVI